MGKAETIQGWKEAKKEKFVPKKLDRPFVLSVVAILFVIYFAFSMATWIMIDTYHRSTIKRVIRVEKKLNAANKQIKWMRQALGITVKGRVKDDSRLDKLDKFLIGKEKKR